MVAGCWCAAADLSGGGSFRAGGGLCWRGCFPDPMTAAALLLSFVHVYISCVLLNFSQAISHIILSSFNYYIS